MARPRMWGLDFIHKYHFLTISVTCIWNQHRTKIILSIVIRNQLLLTRTWNQQNFCWISLTLESISLVVDKMFLDGGGLAQPKIIEAYKDETMWPPNPPEAESYNFHGQWPNLRGWLPNMPQVIVVLLRHCDDQLNIGTSMDGSPHLTIGYKLSNESWMQV